jgi:hypothetical protein
MPALTTIQLRRGSSSQWAASTNPLSQGELGLDTTIKKFKIGDGTSLWSSLPWANIMGADFIGVSGINVSYSSPSGNVTVSVTGLNSSYLSDFNTAVSGLLPVKNILAGTNISVSGNNGVYTISSNGVDTNTVKDVIGATIIGVSGIRASYDNSSKVETISITGLTSSYIGDFNSSVSGLVNGVYAPLNSPALAGTPTVPTAAADTNTTQIASTAFVIGQASSSNPLMDGVVTIGTSKKYARADHVHPTDTTLAPLSGATFTGAVSIPSGTGNFNSLTVNTTGVSLSGHTHTWSNITDASTKATLTELSYLSGVSPGTASSGRALVVDNSKNLTGINALTTTGDVIVGGNLTIQGTTTTVNSTTVNIGDNIVRVNTSGLTTGGLEVYNGSSVQSVVWNTVSNRWEFSGGNVYTSGYFVGNLSGNASTVTNGVYTTDTGTVTSTMIANDTIVNADINTSAAISYGKLNLSNSILNSDIGSSAAIAYSKLNLSGSILDADISSSAAIAVNKLASSGITLGSTTINLGNTTSVIAGLTSISGVSIGSPTVLVNCSIDGGTP